MENIFISAKVKTLNSRKLITFLYAFFDFSKETRTRLRKITDCRADGKTVPSPYILYKKDILEALVREDREFPVIKFDYDLDEEGRLKWAKIVTKTRLIKLIRVTDNEWVRTTSYFNLKYESIKIPIISCPNQLVLDFK